MATDREIERALAALTAAINDEGLPSFDPRKVQAIVTEALSGEISLTVDAGGGLHDQTGVRIGAVRRTDSGEWISERQNETAERSDAAIPAAPPEEGASWLRGVFKKLVG